MADHDFYRAFEDRHRGSRALIKSRVKVYLPFLYPLKAICAIKYCVCRNLRSLPQGMPPYH